MIDLKPCDLCGFKPDLDSEHCITPLDADVWSLNCYTLYGGCGRYVLGWSAEEVVKRWNGEFENE